MSHDKELAKALDACVAAVRRGQTPEQALAGFPALKTELMPLLLLTAELPGSATAEPSPRFRAAARARLMATARASTRQRPTGWRAILSWPGSSLARWPSTVAAALLTSTLAGTLTVSAASTTLPGDTLYPVKRLAEQFELSLTRGEGARHDLELRLTDKRLEETLALAERGQETRAAEGAAGYDEAVQNLDAPDEAAWSEQQAARLTALLEEHQTRLSGVLERAPEPARPALEHALTSSRQGLERAAEAQAHRGQPALPTQGPTPQSDMPGQTPGPPSGVPNKGQSVGPGKAWGALPKPEGDQGAASQEESPRGQWANADRTGAGGEPSPQPGPPAKGKSPDEADGSTDGPRSERGSDHGGGQSQAAPPGRQSR